MSEKTRAEKIAEKLRTNVPSIPTQTSAQTPPSGRVVRQADTVSTDKLAKRRVALARLHDFKDGVL